MMSNQYIKHFCGETPHCSGCLVRNMLTVLRPEQIRMVGLFVRLEIVTGIVTKHSKTFNLDVAGR